jgi:predicted nuclease of predicted toxin-antitoxin system
MKFLVDAQLPRRMVGWLKKGGCDAVHTRDLPGGNRTTDEQLIEIADRDQRAVVTKDEDFVNAHLLSGKPAKLLLVSTGNIKNQELEQLMAPLIPTIVLEFQSHAFLELGRSGIIVRG